MTKEEKAAAKAAEKASKEAEKAAAKEAEANQDSNDAPPSDAKEEKKAAPKKPEPKKELSKAEISALRIKAKEEEEARLAEILEGDFICVRDVLYNGTWYKSGQTLTGANVHLYESGAVARSNLR